MNLAATLQNIADCSSKATISINAVISLISALIAFGKDAYPYVVKVIDSINEMLGKFVEAGDALSETYEGLIKQLKALKTNLEVKIAEHGIITTGEYETFLENVKIMHALQEQAEKDEVAD